MFNDVHQSILPHGLNDWVQGHMEYAVVFSQSTVANVQLYFPRLILLLMLQSKRILGQMLPPAGNK